MASRGDEKQDSHSLGRHAAANTHPLLAGMSLRGGSVPYPLSSRATLDSRSPRSIAHPAPDPTWEAAPGFWGSRSRQPGLQRPWTLLERGPWRSSNAERGRRASSSARRRNWGSGTRRPFLSRLEDLAGDSDPQLGPTLFRLVSTRSPFGRWPRFRIPSDRSDRSTHRTRAGSTF